MLKDFVDMYFLLEQLPLQKITEGFVQKYPDVNVKMAHNALLYFEDFNKKEKINFLGKEISLKEMESRLKVENPRKLPPFGQNKLTPLGHFKLTP